MLDNNVRVNDYNNNNQNEIKSPINNKHLIYHTQIIKLKNEKMAYNRNTEDVFLINLKNEVKFQFNLLFGQKKEE